MTRNAFGKIKAIFVQEIPKVMSIIKLLTAEIKQRFCSKKSFPKKL